MAYNIIKGKVEFSNSTTGSIESLVDDWRNQTIGGVKTFTSTVSASAFWDTTAGGEVRALKSLIGGDGANRVLTSDGDGTLTAEQYVSITDVGANASSVSVTGHITGSTFSGSAHGLTGIILNKDHLAATNYDGLANRLSASNIVLGIGMSSSVDPAGTGHGAELQVTGGQGITVDTEGVRVLTASNGGLAFTGQTLQVDVTKTSNKGGGPSNNDKLVISDSSDSDSIKNLTYSQIKTAITDSISAPAITSYTNASNNRIITSVNGTTVNAEQNLTFDSITLAVSGGANAQRGAFSISGAFDVPLFYVDGFNGRMAMNNDEPGTTFQMTEKGAAPVLGLHRSGSLWYADGDDIGDILWAGSALGATYAGAARIRVEADGSEWNSTSYPTRLSFWTTQTGSSSPSQRMTINNSGNVGIGTTTIPHTLTVAGTVSASLAVSALSFTGDGSGLTGVTGEWDGSHTGNATIIGTLSASNGFRGLDLVLDAGGTGRIGVTGDTDLMTLTANQVAVAGTLSSSLGVTGSAAAFYSSMGAGGQKTITLQNGIVSGSGVSTLHRLDADRIAVDTGDVETLTVTTLIGGSPLSISASAITFSGSVDFSGSSTISASAGTFSALTSSALSGGSPLTLYGDDVTIVANSTTAANFTERHVSSSLNISASGFYGDGSGLTGVTGEWDGSHTGDATIIGTLSASNGFRGLDLVLDAGGTGRIGVTGDTDLMTLTANQVAVAGTLSSSLGVTGSAAAFYSSMGAGGQKTITLQNGIVSGSGVSTLHRLDADRIAVDTGDVETLTVTTLIGGSPLSISASAITFSGSVDFSGSSTISASAGTFSALTSSALSGGSPLTLYGDDVTIVANSTTAANFTESHVSSSLAVSASSFWVNGVSVAAGGAVSAVANGADNRVATFSSADALNGEANLTFDGSTFSVTGESWLTGSVRVDKNHSDTDAATVAGLEIDFDKTGNSTTDNTMYGVKIDMDNTTATNGTNYMYGLHVTPTLTHAADAGTPIVYGALVNAQGGTNGGSIVQALRLEAGGGDFNYGIQMDVEDGGVDLRIESSADSGDYFQIQTTTHGATTFTTVDDDATAAHLTFNVDGDITLDPVGGDVHVDGNISGSGGVHITGSSPKLAIGDKGTLGPNTGMLAIRPSDTSNQVLALMQAAEADGGRTCLGVTGSGQVAVGGLHLDGVLNVSGSDTEHLISAKSDTLNPAFSVTGIGEMFVGQSSYLSGAVRHRYVVKTTSADTYISGATDRVAVYNLSSPHNAYLPELNDSLNGVTITVKSVGSANVTLTGSTNTAQLIDSAANKVLETGDSVTVMGYTGPSGYQWAILNYYNAS